MSGEPVFRVVRGEPTGEELAALTVVLVLSQRRGGRRPIPVTAWSDLGATHRRPLRTGLGGWRSARCAR